MRKPFSAIYFNNKLSWNNRTFFSTNIINFIFKNNIYIAEYQFFLSLKYFSTANLSVDEEELPNFSNFPSFTIKKISIVIFPASAFSHFDNIPLGSLIFSIHGYFFFPVLFFRSKNSLLRFPFSKTIFAT